MRKTQRSVVLTVSRETLLVYAAHLLIIYGTFWHDKSLAGMYSHTLSLAQTTAATFGLVMLMIAVGEVWGRVKQRSRPLARNVSMAGGLIALLIFLIR